MATTKRERQKAARREKMERLQRESKRRQTIRRWVIISIVGAMVLGTGAALFSGGSSTTTTTTIPTTTTTLGATTTTMAQGATTTTGAVTTSTIAATVSTFAPIPAADRSPAGKSGSQPTVTVPTSTHRRNCFQVTSLPELAQQQRLVTHFRCSTYSLPIQLTRFNSLRGLQLRLASSLVLAKLLRAGT